ncbi:hypothetical protein C7293_23760 [filamentous cyanobacterium CCT1]|nr:hypothetical protein C7293_23760 [filamentous cyanobacterium CCT1]PSN77971.1 hypothetical protein C8B47_19295 [filamentous cyanobacterium CCP4]
MQKSKMLGGGNELAARACPLRRLTLFCANQPAQILVTQAAPTLKYRVQQLYSCHRGMDFDS